MQTRKLLTTDGVYNHITHVTDGPITAFVLMARTTDLVADGLAESSDAGNALYEAMLAYGFLSAEGKEVL